jgi:hypothetical protein
MKYYHRNQRWVKEHTGRFETSQYQLMLHLPTVV